MMKSLYTSAFSGITSILDKQIDSYNDQKAAAIDALEAQKKAAEESYQREIDLIEEQISNKQKQIDKINDAKKAREAELDYTKKLYELEKLQGQRTIKTIKDGQVVYEADTSSVRDQKESVQDAKDELRIQKIEKSISSLESQKESIEKMKEASNEYFDQMIQDTEAYWDALINGLENYKSRWEELQDIEEQAKIENTLKQLGFNTTDILNMSEEAFQKYKNDYLNILSDIYHGNDSMYDSLTKVTGVDFTGLNGYLADTQQYIDGLTKLDVNAFNESLATMGEGLSSITDSASGVASAIGGGGNAKGTGKSSNDKKESNATSSIKSSVEDTAKTITEKITEATQPFADLTQAVNDTSGSIGGGSGSGNNAIPGKGKGSVIGGSSVSGGIGTGNGLKGSVEDFGETTDSVVPNATTKFNELDAIADKAAKDVGGISEAIQDIDGLEATASITINVETTGNASSLLGKSLAGISNANGTANFDNKEYSLAYVGGSAKYIGTANVSGNWAVQEGGRSLVGELGVEGLVRNGHFFTVGNNGAEFIDIRKGDILFNHIQTEQLLKNGSITSRGKAYASGTIPNLPDKYIPLSVADPEKYKKILAMQEAFKNMSMDGAINRAFEVQTKQLENTFKQVMNVTMKQNNTPTEIHFDNVQINCPNVTNDSGVQYINKELGNLSLKALQYFNKR